MNDAYGEGQFKPNVAYVYILFINNISQFVAMYCLVLFYKANRQELQPMKPLPKFLCIKAVIFFSFFQGVIINFLVYFGFISNVFGELDPDKTDPHLLSTKLQDFLICIEMFLAAVAHHYSFPHKPFHINVPNYDATNRGFLNALMTMLDISDVTDDLGEHIGVVGSSFARRLQGRGNYYHVPRGRVGERDYLITDQMNYQSSSSSMVAVKQSNRYGAMNIVRPPPKRDDDGFVQANLFSVNYPSTQSSMTTTTSSPTETTTENTEATTGLATSTLNLKKSDSSNSDWISDQQQQQPNDFIEVNVRWREQNQIKYRYDDDDKKA